MKLKRVAKIVLCLALLFVMGGECLLSPFLVKAEANTSKYSNVLDDLKKDKTFSAENYPLDGTRNDLQIIQIAESENRELFIYVYQPGYETKDYQAKYINMALQDMIDPDLEYKLYSLTFLNSDGQFAKYLVEGLYIPSYTYRFYNISALYREFDKEVDKSSTMVDGYSCKSIPVASLWTATNYNGEVIYNHEVINVLQYDVFYCDSIRYLDGYPLAPIEACDAHFIGWTPVNYSIDKVIDAKVIYTVQEKRWYRRIFGKDTIEDWGSPLTVECNLSDMSDPYYKGSSLFSKEYSWDRIQTSESYMKQLEDYRGGATDEALAALEKCQFVFGFLETRYYEPYSADNNPFDADIYHYSEVVDIGILSVKFYSNGVFYNLGCVGDLVISDGIPDSTEKDEGWLQVIVGLFVILIFVSFLTPIVGPILPVLGKLLIDGIFFFLKSVFALLLIPWNFLFKKKNKK